eukprot:COSAG02_NODE_48237_length_335_cov_0.860169_1_plen_45_part_01
MYEGGAAATRLGQRAGLRVCLTLSFALSVFLSLPPLPPLLVRSTG